MGKISVPTTFNIDLEFETAEFPTRLIAWVIDLSIELLYVYLVFKLLSGLWPNLNGSDGYGIAIISMAPLFIYQLVSEILWNGQTVGKRIMNIRIVNDAGAKASISQFVIRWALRGSDLTILLILLASVVGDAGTLKGLMVTSFILLADIILVLATKRHKRLGDVAAGTMLIRTRPRGNLQDTIFMEVGQAYVPLFPSVMRLSDRDINTIKTILDTARKRGFYEMADNASTRIKSVLGIQTDMPAYQFLDTLLMDYNFLSTR